ncbi:H(+)-transporting V0 sector ATPase subunit a [Glugoides intestinalis]
MLRSEKVECISLYCSADSIRGVLERVGNSSTIQLIGKDNTYFDKESRDLEKTEQRLQYLRKEAIKSGFEDEVCENEEVYEKHKLIDVEADINKYYEKLTFLKTSKSTCIEKEHSFEQTLKMITVSRNFVGELKENADETTLSFDFITAIIESDKKLMLKQMLKHRLRKNVYLKLHEVTLKTAAKKYTVFIVYALGEDNKEFSRVIIKKLGGRIFDYSTSSNILHNEIEESYKRIKRLKKSVEKQMIQTIDDIKQSISMWRYVINKERAMIEALKKLEKVESTSCYIGEGWALKKDMEKLERLKCFDNDKGRFIFERKKPTHTIPTHFEPSEFSKAFQNLTNVFGIPKYGEINPGVFMLFTFPFLFGAMFGDILHGLILLSISFFLIKRYEQLNKKCGVFQIILDGRYVVLSCSIAAIWFGFLYGDFGSLPVALFASQFETGRTYPFGIDPAWHHAVNKMIFINSLKMKLSLILGFFHMGLGASIAIANAIYFKDKLSLFCIAIPQAIAFFLFLGYLTFLCIYKWLVTVTYPSLVNTLISMYTDPFNMKNQMYPGQMYVQIFIVSIIIICLPWMMFSKPLYVIFKKKVPEDGMLDLWITSGIHVVEFFLGLISNTSSYLRLWAVSLAHVQLTTVLHEFTIGNSSLLVKLITFPVYICGTFMLLIGLEGLSSCLHALRLNWIEFFSKFYSGSGVLFEPLNFKVKEEED